MINPNQFKNGNKVFCYGRVSWIFKYRPPMCGTIKYKVPGLLGKIINIQFVLKEKGDIYCVKMADGENIFYHISGINHIDKEILFYQRVLNDRRITITPIQLSAGNKIESWIKDMQNFLSLNHG
jgi:hypothetical protein